MLLCGCVTSTPTKEVEKYFNKYQTNSDDILDKVDKIFDFTNYSDLDKEEYKKIIKKNYQDLVYVIKDEKIDANKAIVTVEIEVYDFYKTMKETLEYRNTYMDKFITDDFYNENLFINYRLDKLKEVKERIKYTLDISLTKVDNKWYVDDLSKDFLEKINGIYNYQ